MFCSTIQAIHAWPGNPICSFKLLAIAIYRRLCLLLYLSPGLNYLMQPTNNFSFDWMVNRDLAWRWTWCVINTIFLHLLSLLPSIRLSRQNYVGCKKFNLIIIKWLNNSTLMYLVSFNRLIFQSYTFDLNVKYDIINF